MPTTVPVSTWPGRQRLMASFLGSLLLVSCSGSAGGPTTATGAPPATTPEPPHDGPCVVTSEDGQPFYQVALARSPDQPPFLVARTSGSRIDFQQAGTTLTARATVDLVEYFPRAGGAPLAGGATLAGYVVPRELTTRPAHMVRFSAVLSAEVPLRPVTQEGDRLQLEAVEMPSWLSGSLPRIALPCGELSSLKVTQADSPPEHPEERDWVELASERAIPVAETSRGAPLLQIGPAIFSTLDALERRNGSVRIAFSKDDYRVEGWVSENDTERTSKHRILPPRLHMGSTEIPNPPPPSASGPRSCATPLPLLGPGPEHRVVGELAAETVFWATPKTTELAELKTLFFWGPVELAPGAVFVPLARCAKWLEKDLPFHLVTAPGVPRTQGAP